MQRVRAIITNDKFLLTIKRLKDGEIYWVFPGGGVGDGENHEQALMRECLEELGVEVKVRKLFHEDFFGNREFGKQKEFFYLCKIVGGKLGTGAGQEWQENSKCEGTREIQWLEIAKLDDFDLRPKVLKDKILSL